jgi:hypothetical protein
MPTAILRVLLHGFVCGDGGERQEALISSGFISKEYFGDLEPFFINSMVPKNGKKDLLS